MKGRLVEKLANRGCITINKEALISELIDLLSSNNIGAAVVVDKERKPIGMVSERDIIKNYNSNKIKNIDDIMSTNVINCDLSFSSSQLMELMNKNKIRHIPIVEKNKLLGIVSIGDVVKRLIEIYETENLNLKNYINS